MQRLFGTAAARGKQPSSEAAEPSAEDRTNIGPAMETLRDTSAMVEKRESHLARLIANEVDTARKHATAGQQREALLAMKRKKILEKELEQLAAGKLTLFQEEQALSALKFNSLVHEAHVQAMSAMEREIKRVKGVDGVEKVQDKLEDLLADAGDVLDAGNRTVGEAANLDDDELLQELEQMEMDELSKQLTQVGSGSGASSSSHDAAVETHQFAQVPTEKPRSAQREKEEREERELLAELQASMATMKVEAPMPMPMAARMTACC